MTQVSSGPVTAFAPGRINLIGEHTDYNEGWVLPAAIRQGITFSVEPNGKVDSGWIRADDLGETIFFDLSSWTPKPGSWENYVLGLCRQIRMHGGTVGGFHAHFSGTVPIGAGLSSSAALLCASALAIDHCFGLDFPREKWMTLTQATEHRYVGTQCGLMDMFASLFGRPNHVMWFDCRNISHKYIPLHLGNYQLLLVDTRVSHQLAGSEYNTRRRECEEALAVIRTAFPEICTLRDVTLEMLAQCRNSLPENLVHRAKYVIEENARVFQAVQCLEKGDMAGLGKCLLDTHTGLRDDYAVSCPELDFLVGFAARSPEALGARMMGGGFGGCTLHLVEKNSKEGYLARIQEAFFGHFGMLPPAYPVEASAGAHLLA